MCIRDSSYIGPVGPIGTGSRWPVSPPVGLRPPRTLRHLGPLCRPSASWPYRPHWPGGGGCAPPHTLSAYLEEAKASSNSSDSMIGSRSCLDPDLASGSGIQIWNLDLASRSGTQIWHPDLASRSGIQIWYPDLVSGSGIGSRIGFNIGFRGASALEAEGRPNGGLGAEPPGKKLSFFLPGRDSPRCRTNAEIPSHLDGLPCPQIG